MTAEQYNLLIQFANNFSSAVSAYEHEYGIIDLKTDPISEIVTEAANMMHLIYALEPVPSQEDTAPF
jgi:hypothetical protein